MGRDRPFDNEGPKERVVKVGKEIPLNLHSSVHQLYHNKTGTEEKMEKEKLRELHYLTALTYFSQQIRSQGVLPGVKEKVIGYGV